MVYLIVDSPAGASAQLVQADARTARADPQFYYRGEERAAQRALIERCARDMDKSILALDGREAQRKAIQKHSGVNWNGAGSIWVEVRHGSRSKHQPGSGPNSLRPGGPMGAGRDGDPRTWSRPTIRAQRDVALTSFEAQGYFEDEAKDAAEKSVQNFQNARRDALEALRGSVNSQLLLINDLFNIDGPPVTLRDDGTLGFGDAVASWTGKVGSLALVAGNAQVPDGTATRIEPFDGTVREQSDPPSTSTARPEDAPVVGGFVNKRA